ncbi:MAG: hypothetical protein VKO26_02335 [Cyanobacteriota bacterium]|nr:hypothetical protein [Cyanobacteriota bacterium]
MLSPQDPFPRQQGGVATRLILSASAANDPERLKRVIERWRRGAGVMAGRGPHSLEPSNLTAPERERGGHHPSPPAPLSPASLSAERLPWTPLQVTRLTAVVADIHHLGRAIERVRRRLGCPHCCSGFDLDFQRELEMLALTTEREPGGSTP